MIESRSVSEWLQECHTPIVLTHRRPDGDALGATAALHRYLTSLGKKPQTALFDPVPARYDWLADAVPWLDWETSRDVLAHNCDAVIIADTCSLNQLESALEFLRQAPRILVIDHHQTYDDIGTRPGDLRVFDDTAAATCLMVHELLRDLGATVDETTAQALFAGIATDCGWFRFSNTDARVLEAAAALVSLGVAPHRLYSLIHEREHPARLRLAARMLDRMQLHADGRLAVLSLRPADFEATGADRTMTDDLVNEPGKLAGVVATIMFTEEEDGTIRANFRSKHTLDVADLATRYGGGGHARAAGARLHGAWDATLPRVIEEAAQGLGSA